MITLVVMKPLVRGLECRAKPAKSASPLSQADRQPRIGLVAWACLSASDARKRVECHAGCWQKMLAPSLFQAGASSTAYQ